MAPEPGPGPTDAREFRHLLRRNNALLSLSWAHLLNDGASNYLPGVLPAVLVSLHDPLSLAGVLTAALIAGQAAQPLTGWLADRVGGRLLSPLGLLMSSLGGGLIGLAHSTAALVGLLLVIGLGGAAFHPQALAAIRRMGGSGHGLRTSIFLVGGELGRGLWPTAASVVVEHMGLDGLWVVGVPGLLSVPLLWRATPKQPRRPLDAARIDWRHHAKPLSLL
ncbi:MAG: MFS transporter, partial [Solirubrobacteraceae bacterium]